MTEREAAIINLIKREVKPALGCTEPIAVALAVAKAVEIIQEKCLCLEEGWRKDAEFNINVHVSGNILKNGMGVGIPGTGMIGLYIASALGAVCGKSRYGLEVLHDLDSESIARAKKLVEENRIKISVADTEHKLYVRANVTIARPVGKKSYPECGECARNVSEEHCAVAVIEDDHDNIVETCFDNNILHSSHNAATSAEEESGSDTGRQLTVREIYDFAKSVAYKDIEFILESRTLNLALAKEGLEGDYGLKVGKTVMSSKYEEVFGKDFISYAMAYTAAASDARMAGCTLPAMSNSGSGNQGITVTMPVIAYSIKYGISDEQLARALVLSHLTAIHIKSYLGKLSALCGCVIASTGSSCGIVYLRGGTYEQVCSAIKNMIGNITGMVCDGAKVGCALKVASGVSSAIQSAVLALDGTCISEHDGIIEKDIEKTIRNLGNIGSVGMQNTDNMILDIMVCK